MPSDNSKPAYWHDTQHSMSRRNKKLSYHGGGIAYMITLKIEEGAKLLGCLPAWGEVLSATRCRIEEERRAASPLAAVEEERRAASPALEEGHGAASPLVDEERRTPSPALEEGQEAASPLEAGTAEAVALENVASPEDVRMVLLPLGEAMREAWLSLPERFPNISIRDRRDEYVIMPEHFHGIVFATGLMEEHLSDVEKLFKQRVTMAYRELMIQGRCEAVGLGRQWLAEYQRLAPEQQEEVREWVRRQRECLYSATRCGTQGDTAPIRVCASGKRQKQGFLFMTNYTDKPFSDEKTLHDKRHYILHNPIERVKRGSNPEWLRAKRGGIETALTVPALFGYLRRECMDKDVTPELLAQVEGWLMVSATRCRIEVRVRKKAGHNGLGAGHNGFGAGHNGFGAGHSGLGAGQDVVRVIEGCMIECDSYGNRELLVREKHRLLPLVCHRRDAWQYERQRAACMAAARDGAVIVCACISPKENALFKEIVAAGYKAIRIEDNGFPEIYHPSEERQHLCATGNHLIVTPWRYHYVPKDVSIRTAYCKAMNCLAQALCGCSDGWWKGE